MRYTPVALSLSLFALISASTGHSAAPALDPSAAALEAQGKAALTAGAIADATDDFEAALAIDPGSSALTLDLAKAARADGMQGKALHYYRLVLTREPQNLAAISGEGAALVEKGATEKAKRNLAQLQNLCGANCEATKDLAALLTKPSQPPVLTAEAMKPKTQVSAN